MILNLNRLVACGAKFGYDGGCDSKLLFSYQLPNCLAQDGSWASQTFNEMV